MDDKQERETLFEKHRENIYFRWGLTAFVVIVACIVVAQFVTKLTAFFGILGALFRTLAPVCYGLGIAYLLDPIVGRVAKFLQPKIAARLRRPEKAETISRGLGVLVSLILMIFLVWALLAMVLPQLLDSLNTIAGNLPMYYNTLNKWVTSHITSNIEMADFTNEMMDKLYEYFNNWLTSSLLPKVQDIMASLTASVVNLAKALLNLIIGVIISIYLLMGKRKFLSQAKKFCYAILGTKRGGYLCNVCTFANQAFGGFIGGKIVDSAIIGVLCFFGLQVLDMPYAMLISIIVGVTNVIPFFGPYLGAIPSALLLLVINPMQCLTFIIFIIILQQLDGNVIGPMILGDATGLNGFWVVVSILVFGSFFGLLGMIIAVPLFAVIYKILAEITNRLLSNQGLSTVTSDYEAWNYPPRVNSEKWRRPLNRRKHRRAARKAAKANPPQEPPQDSENS